MPQLRREFLFFGNFIFPVLELRGEEIGNIPQSPVGN